MTNKESCPFCGKSMGGPKGGYDLNEPCWGCGSIGEHPEFGGHYWPCGTMKCSSIRGDDCYEREIAARDKVLKEALRLLDEQGEADAFLETLARTNAKVRALMEE
jgi:hypothetical protein